MVRERILVVEDESLVAASIKLQLEELGYVVVGTCGTGAEALAMASTLQPDLVLMDIVLAGRMDGIATAELIHRQYDIPIVYLTGYADDARIEQAKLSDSYGYIVKPCQTRELHAVITLALYRAKTIRELQVAAWTSATLMAICDTVITLDTQMRISTMNPAAERLLQVRLADVAGEPIDSVAKLTDRPDRVWLGEIIASVMESGEAFRCETEAVLELRDGTRQPVHFSASPINDAAGKTLGIALVVHDDSARSKAERDLLESERKFRALAESTNAAILVYRDKFLYVNAAAERFSGYTHDELLEKSLAELVHPEYREMIAARLRQRLAGDDTPLSYRIRILTKTGAERWVEISAGMIEYDGKPAGVATAFDITGHIAAEAALRATERRLTAIMENTGAVIYVKDTEGRLTLVNKEYERVFGLTREAIIGKVGSELVPKEVAEKIRVNDLAVAAASGPLIVEERVVLQGDERDYISVKVPLCDDHGKVYAICGISTDISEQKRKERGMQKLGHWAQRLLDTNTDEAAFYREVSAGIVDLVGADVGAMPCLDDDGANFTYRGATGEHAALLMGQSMPVIGGGLCGWVAKQGIPLSVPDLFADARVLPDLARAMEVTTALVVPLIQDQVVIGGLSAFRKGRPFDAVDLEFLTLYSQRVALAMGNMRLLKTLEQRVAERTAQLANSNAELEAFSYSVSHDLRAPLRSIEGFSQALLEDYRAVLDEQGRDYLQRVRNGAARMSDLIDDLLALSRVSRSAMIRGPVDLSALATTVAQTLQARAPQRRVSIEVVPGLSAVGDARLLQIALENLLGNAWKFTRKQPQAHIEFGVTEQDGMPAYYVRDNGAGFDMAHAAKLFGAFERLHLDSDFEGTGIGLATVRRVIQRHGGKVWAEGKPGQGATFYFTL